MEGNAKAKRKYKKKDNFRRQVKRFAGKGTYGKGGNQLTNDQYTYYMNIFELLKNAEGEEKELLVQNFLRGVVENEEVKKLASNQIVSRILDDTLQYGKPTLVLSLCQVLTEDIRVTCLDPYASHVLQTLMSLALKFSQKNSVQETKSETEEGTEEDEEFLVTKEQRKQFTSLLNKIGRFIFNNLEEFMRDTYGSHVFRSLLETCSGVHVKDSIKRSKKSQTNHDLGQDAQLVLKIPTCLKDLLKDIASRLFQLPDLPGIITTECSSAATQSALLVLKGTESNELPALVDHVVLNGFANISPSCCNHYEELSDLPLLFQSTPAEHLLEVVMLCTTTDQLKRLYTQYFKGHMPALVVHQVGNFAVQKLLLSWQEKDTFYEVFEAVQEVLPAAAEVKYTGIFLALSQACGKLAKSQGQCWKVILQHLRCYEPQERQLATAPCLLWFLSYEEYQEKHAAGELPSISLHGCLILQEFLRYIRTMKVVQSVFAMNKADLQLMACDPRGSHVIDAFKSSSYITVITKEKLINCFKGMYVALACSKHGSRSLEALWDVASVRYKTEICEELVNEELKVKGDTHGTIIFNKFKVRLFNKKDKRDWQELIDSATRKKRLLNDLLNDVNEDEAKTKKKKKKKTFDK